MTKLSFFLCLSAAIHAAALAGFTLCIPPQTGMIGSPDGDPDRVFVMVVSDQDLTAIAAVPNPVDSIASRESKPEQTTEIQELTEPEPQTIVNPDFQIADQEKQLEKEQEKSSESIPQVASDARTRRTALGTDVRDFQSRVVAAIRQATFFPQQALSEKRHGEVTIAFVINRDGTLSSVRVALSSGSKVLDDAAQEILQKASKAFPVFPASVRDETLAYNVPIHFKEKGPGHRSRATATP